MMMTSLVISMLLTIFVLVLSIVVISKGYGYKHKIDPATKDDDQADGSASDQKE
ncbi:MAG TPA: YtzI protein [Bacillota bacterium]